jgi:hypothetical protein
MTRPRLPEPSSCSARRSDPAFVRSSTPIAARLIFFPEKNRGRGGAISLAASRETIRDGRWSEGSGCSEQRAPDAPLGAFGSSLVRFRRRHGSITGRDVQGARAPWLRLGGLGDRDRHARLGDRDRHVQSDWARADDGRDRSGRIPQRSRDSWLTAASNRARASGVGGTDLRPRRR